MRSSSSTTKMFRLSSDDAVDKLVIVLSSVFHVVPAIVGDRDGRVLSVEIDLEHPWLVEDVRQLVLEGDPGATELEESVAADQVP